MEYGEDIDAAIHREIAEETGLTGLPFRQFRTFGKPGRDPRGHTVSVVYVAVLIGEAPAVAGGDDAAAAAWFPVTSLPDLAFDHGQILGQVLDTLKRITDPVTGAGLRPVPAGLPHKEMNVSNNLNPETVMAALKDVKVPGTKVDVVSIDLIGEIKVTGGEVVVTVVKTTEKDETIAAVREGVAQAVSRLARRAVGERAAGRPVRPRKPRPPVPTASRPTPSPTARSCRA